MSATDSMHRPAAAIAGPFRQESTEIGDAYTHYCVNLPEIGNVGRLTRADARAVCGAYRDENATRASVERAWNACRGEL